MRLVADSAIFRRSAGLAVSSCTGHMDIQCPTRRSMCARLWEILVCTVGRLTAQRPETPLVRSFFLLYCVFFTYFTGRDEHDARTVRGHAHGCRIQAPWVISFSKLLVPYIYSTVVTSDELNVDRVEYPCEYQFYPW